MNSWQGYSNATVCEYDFQYSFVINDFISVNNFLKSAPGAASIDSKPFSIGGNNGFSAKIRLVLSGNLLPIASIVKVKQDIPTMWLKELKCAVIKDNLELVSSMFENKDVVLLDNRILPLNCNIGQQIMNLRNNLLGRNTAWGAVLDYCLTDGNLVLHFTGNVSIPSTDWHIPEENKNLVTASTTSNFEKLWNTKQFSDVDILCDDQNFAAHKCILWARSNVFAKMFEQNNEGAQTNIFKIEDISADVFEEGLYFIYTGKYPNLKIMATDLLVFAEKYDILDLKNICEKEIIGSICVENVCDLFSLSEEQHADNLRSASLQFIKDNSKLVMATPAWKILRKVHPDVITELLEAMVLG